jgi:hypothetical protein
MRLAAIMEVYGIKQIAAHTKSTAPVSSNLPEQAHLSGIENTAGNHPGSVGGIFDLRGKPELPPAPGARSTRHGHALSGVVAGMAGGTKYRDRLPVPGVMVHVGGIEIPVTGPALGALVAAEVEEGEAVAAPFGPVILPQLGADRHGFIAIIS